MKTHADHQKLWDFLQRKYRENQLAHAYIFAGGNPKEMIDFSKRLVKSIVGEKHFDNVIDQEQFPDLLVVRSLQSDSSLKNEKDMMEIDVGQIRQVNNFLSYTSYYGSYKIVIIENAERLNQEAQSCLLKTLEEPRGRTLIILLSVKPESLMPTILSRTQLLKFLGESLAEISPPEKKLIADLEDLLVSDLASKFLYAKKVDFDTQSLESILVVWQRYFRELLLESFGLGLNKKHNLKPEKIKKILQAIETLQFQTMKFNVNAKLALETLLLEI